MGFLRDQASRLLRTKWGGNADMLAEELYAIMTGDEDIVFDSPVTIVNTTDSPPLTLRDFGDSDSSISITKQRQPPPVLPEIPPLDFSGVGEVTLGKVYPDGSSEGWAGDAASPPQSTPGTGARPGTGGGGGGFPGRVTAGGPGDAYTVDVYLDGLAAAPTSKTVRQLSIAADATIPAGTWALVGAVRESDNSTTYFMQVPVWLEDLP